MSTEASGTPEKPTVWGRITRELRSIIPAMVYFFVAFSLFNLTFGRMMSYAGVHANSLARTIVMSLIIGKVVLIANHMPFFNLFRNRPLIFNTLWKASIYTLFNLIVRVIENIVRLAPEFNGAGNAWHHVVTMLSPLRIFTVHLWFFVLFTVFIVGAEVFDMVGREKLRKVYLGF
jgi:hypothetical protein